MSLKLKKVKVLTHQNEKKDIWEELHDVFKG